MFRSRLWLIIVVFGMLFMSVVPAMAQEATESPPTEIEKLFLVTGAFGGTSTDDEGNVIYWGEVSGSVIRLEDVQEETLYGLPVYTGYLPLRDGGRALVVATLLGVGPLNSTTQVGELYDRYGDRVLVHIHGGINGGDHEVGSSSVPSTVCYVDSFFNYPVLAPQPIFVEEGDTLAALMEEHEWDEADVALLRERNPGKLPEDPESALPVMQLVGVVDVAYNDHFIPLGADLHMQDNNILQLETTCLELDPDLHTLAVEAAQATTLPNLPPEIEAYIADHGRDPNAANMIHTGTSDNPEVLCAGNIFFASPMEAWRQREIWSCDGADMETPFVAWATARETSDPLPDLVVFRTSSDPPAWNTGRPQMTASEYLADPAAGYDRAFESLEGVFALPVVPHQAESYGRFVEEFINLYMEQLG